MEYKYEQIFGDQSLFDGAPEDAEAVGGGKPLQDALVFYKFSDGEFQYKYEAEIDDWKVSTCKHPQSVIKAMRRIIKEPKRWTRADMDAGRLPEVGAEVIRVDHEDEGCNVTGVVIATWRCIENNTLSQVCLKLKDGSLFLVDLYEELKPIETPAEKAQLLRDEWVESVMNLTPCADASMFLITAQENQTKRIYDALLSGELTAPKGGE